MMTTLLEIFHEYFYSFLHPFKLHRSLAQSRVRARSMPQLRLATWGDTTGIKSTKVPGLELVELVGVSWFFVIIRGLYSLVSINFGILVYQNYFSDNLPLLEEIFSPVTLQAQKMLLLYVVGEAALYPLVLWFYIKVWSVLINFFGNLFSIEGDINLMTEQIVGHSLVGHFFLLIPIFGEVARYFSSIVYIFAGLRNNMRMSVLQSVIVISSPLLLLLMFILMLFAYIVAVLSVL